jgi:HAD superfamily hydrolase (TIGR01549 family)
MSEVAPNPTRISGIFFDLGNVLVEVNYREFAARLTSLTGKPMEELRPAFTDGLVVRYELGLCEEGEFLSTLCGRIGLRQTDFLEAWTSIFAAKPLIPEDVIMDLSRKYRLWIISNTNRMHFDYIRGHYSFLACFHGLILSYEVGAAKPDPAIFKLALERAGIKPDEAVFVDDQLANVKAAREIGIDAIRFLNLDQLLLEFRERHLLP